MGPESRGYNMKTSENLSIKSLTSFMCAGVVSMVSRLLLAASWSPAPMKVATCPRLTSSGGSRVQC